MEALTSIFGLLPPHCGKCWHVPAKPKTYQFSGFYSNIYICTTETCSSFYVQDKVVYIV